MIVMVVVVVAAVIVLPLTILPLTILPLTVLSLTILPLTILSLTILLLSSAMQDNSAWDLRMDEQIMSWAVQRPEDWQLGGRCEAFMWGGGRIGQLGEAGRTVLTPTTAQSFSCAQQVTASSVACFILRCLLECVRLGKPA